eukprot:204298-Rhodomonas_salina.3
MPGTDTARRCGPTRLLGGQRRFLGCLGARAYQPSAAKTGDTPAPLYGGGAAVYGGSAGISSGSATVYAGAAAVASVIFDAT